jgi:hypothetical protein
MDTSLTLSEPSVIRLFLANGSPDGLRLVEKSGWIGCAALFPRSRFPELRGRPELKRTGVYLLFGDTVEQQRQQVYIGEGDPVLNRLTQHFREKDFWSHAIVFTSRDENLHKAHLQNLEAALIRLARSVNRCQLVNANIPEEPSLSEIDHAETKLFLSQLLTVLNILGVSIFQRPAPATRSTPIFHAEAKGLRAEGYETDQGFVVRSGSESPVEVAPSCMASIEALRSQLKEQGALKQSGGKLVLTQDYLFASPSQAATVMLARAANGRTEWKTDDGRSLKQLQEAALDREVVAAKA